MEINIEQKIKEKTNKLKKQKLKTKIEEINLSRSKELETMDERIAAYENRNKEANIRSNENEQFS